jgi:hypothetical protein
VQLRHADADGEATGVPWLLGRVGGLQTTLQASPDMLRRELAPPISSVGMQLASLRLDVGGVAALNSPLTYHAVCPDGACVGGVTSRVIGALTGLVAEPERVRAMALPKDCTRAERRRARERNTYGKACADGAAMLQLGTVLTSEDALALVVSLDAKLEAAGSGDERDLTLSVRLAPTSGAHAAAARLHTALEVSPLLTELQTLGRVLERNRHVDAAHLPGGVAWDGAELRSVVRRSSIGSFVR